MSKTDKSLSSQSWQASVQLVEHFLKTSAKLDELLEERSRTLDGKVIPRVQFLTYGVVKNLGRLRELLRAGTAKAPKKRLQAVLLVALFEWLEASEEDRPRVVHFTVEQVKRGLSRPESRFTNAFLRRMPELLEQEPTQLETCQDLSRIFSHPLWLVERWIDRWGFGPVRSLLEWNQRSAKTYAFSFVPGSRVPEDWNSTDWPGFYEIQDSDWETIRAWLEAGKAYIQDPSTRLGSELLAGKSLSSLLDLCAAPGGKSVQLLRQLKGAESLLVSVDVPGKRFERLQANLARYKNTAVHAIQIPADILQLEAIDLPRPRFDAVYVDVPCSNTGVFQRRPDVRWRLAGTDLTELVRLQETLLNKAAGFVRDDGVLVYSTCSIEPEENEDLIARFLSNRPGEFILEKSASSLPWESGHDGAAAFLLKKVK